MKSSFSHFFEIIFSSEIVVFMAIALIALVWSEPSFANFAQPFVTKANDLQNQLITIGLAAAGVTFAVCFLLSLGGHIPWRFAITAAVVAIGLKSFQTLYAWVTQL